MVVVDNYKSNESAKSNCINCRRSQKEIAERKWIYEELADELSCWKMRHESYALKNEELEMARIKPSMKASCQIKIERGNED